MIYIYLIYFLVSQAGFHPAFFFFFPALSMIMNKDCVSHSKKILLAVTDKIRSFVPGMLVTHFFLLRDVTPVAVSMKCSLVSPLAVMNTAMISGKRKISH